MDPQEQKFFKTTFAVEVLSEDCSMEHAPVSLAVLHDAITTGDCSGVVRHVSTEELSPARAAAALLEQGSDPGFFGLDDVEPEEGVEAAGTSRSLQSLLPIEAESEGEELAEALAVHLGQCGVEDFRALSQAVGILLGLAAYEKTGRVADAVATWNRNQVRENNDPRSEWSFVVDRVQGFLAGPEGLWLPITGVEYDSSKPAVCEESRQAAEELVDELNRSGVGREGLLAMIESRGLFAPLADQLSDSQLRSIEALEARRRGPTPG